MKMKLQRIFAVLVLLGLLLAACGPAQPLTLSTATPMAATPSATSAPTQTIAPAATLTATTAAATTTPTNPAASAVKLDCQDQANLMDGPFRAENNTWGKGSLTGWTQCIGLLANDDGSITARWTWDWPISGGNVKSYPEIIYGQKPGSKTTTTDLPRQVSGLSELQILYDVTSTHTGGGNLAFDIWLTDSSDPSTWGAPPITHEIMIWLESFGSMAPGGNWKEVVKIDGAPYSVYTAKGWGDGWDYVAFVLTEPQVGAGSINLVSFLSYMKSKGLITGEEYVASVEFGNEVTGGKGETHLNRLAISVR